MTITVTPVQNNQTFGAWLATTNRLANIISQNTVTSDTTLGGSVTTGNAYVNGYFGASYLYAESALIGGNVSANSTLNVIANVAFKYSTTNLAIITANSTNANLEIRTDNTAIVGNTLYISASINAVSSANLAGAVAIANTLSVSNAATFSDTIFAETILPTVSETFTLGSVTNLYDTVYTKNIAFVGGAANGTQYTGTANNANNLGGQAPSYYTDASNITTGTLPNDRLSSAIVNTSAAFTLSGVITYSANLVLGSSAGIVANGSVGTNGQVLYSNGTSAYWSAVTAGTVTSVGSGNGLTGGPITTSGSLSVLANTGLVANATGVHVNTTYLTAYIGNSTSNNATNFAGQPASFYANASNITTGTLATARLPATANISTAINVGANVGLTTTQISVSNSTSNVVITAGALTIGGVNVNTAITGNAATAYANAVEYSSNASTLVTGTVPTARLPAASVSAAGIVQLVDSTSNSSITHAATANSVKTVYDFAAQIAATGTPPGGTNTHVQFNNSNTFAGSANFTFNTTTATLAVSNTITAAAFTAGNVSITTTNIRVGNATVNASISAGALTINGVNVNTAITGNAATAYSNGVTYTNTKAAEAYSNGVSYTNTKAGEAYTNATSYADTRAATAYSNAVSYANTVAATAYSNATAYADTRAATAYTNAVSYANSIAATAYTNATAFASNATNITAGTLNTARLPATISVSTSVDVGANVSMGVASIRVGNSTINTNISAGSLTINGTNVNTAITSNAATAYTNATAFASNATNITSGTLNTARLPATANISTAVNVGTDVNLTTSQIQVGNSSVNTVIGANSITLNGVSVTNASILTSGTLDTQRLPATVNVATAINVGSNVNISTSNVSVGNSTINSNIAAAFLNINRGSVQGHVYADNSNTFMGVGTKSNHPLFLIANNGGMGYVSGDGRLRIDGSSTYTSYAYAEIQSDGGLELYRSLSSPVGTVQGDGPYIDFKVNTSSDWEMRIQYAESGRDGLSFYNDPPGTELMFLNGTNGNLNVLGFVTSASDISYKENISTIVNALEKTKQLRGVNFTRIGDETAKMQVGFIAQEVVEVLPEVVVESTADEKLHLAYGNITALLVEAIKEQQEQIELLKSQVAALQKA